MTATGWLRYAWALLAGLGTAALIAGAAAFVFAWDGVRVETRTEPPGPLSSSASRADVAERLGPSSMSIAGGEVGPALEGATCAVYRLADGVALVCG